MSHYIHTVCMKEDYLDDCVTPGFTEDRGPSQTTTTAMPTSPGPGGKLLIQQLFEGFQCAVLEVLPSYLQ